MTTPHPKHPVARSSGLHLVQGLPARPPIAFLHGVLRRWQTFRPLLCSLAGGFETWGIDFPGHGRSAWQPGRYCVTDYVAAAATKLVAHAPSPVVLYGHSLGAMVAAGVAAELGEQVQGLILEDPPFDTLGSRIHETPWHAYFQAIRGLVRDDRFRRSHLSDQSRMLAELQSPDPISLRTVRLGEVRDPASIRFFASCLARIDPTVLDPIVEGHWLEQYDWRALAARIRAPVLILQADPAAGGMLIDADAQVFAEAVPDATLVKLRGAGHNLHTSRTLEVVGLVTQFLDTLDSPPSRS